MFRAVDFSQYQRRGDAVCCLGRPVAGPYFFRIKVATSMTTEHTAEGNYSQKPGVWNVLPEAVD